MLLLHGSVKQTKLVRRSKNSILDSDKGGMKETKGRTNVWLCIEDGIEAPWSDD